MKIRSEQDLENLADHCRSLRFVAAAEKLANDAMINAWYGRWHTIYYAIMRSHGETVYLHPDHWPALNSTLAAPGESGSDPSASAASGTAIGGVLALEDEPMDDVRCTSDSTAESMPELIPVQQTVEETSMIVDPDPTREPGFTDGE